MKSGRHDRLRNTASVFPPNLDRAGLGAHNVLRVRSRNVVPWSPRRSAVLCILWIALLHGPHASAQQPGPPPAVVVAPIESRDIAATTEFVGRVEAIQAVDIRARVEGYLHQVAFEEGQDVKSGDLLFVIEQAPYQAARDNAQAQVSRAQANLRNAEQALERAQSLRASGSGTQATLDQATAARNTGTADLEAAQADLRTAELNLGYTRITAPISGRIGRATYTQGNLVNTSSNPLARIVQMDPIRVVYSVSDRDVIAVRQEMPNAKKEDLYRQFVPRLRLSTGTMYPSAGEVDFVDNEIDPNTGTIAVRANFDNKQSLLIPGQYVTVLVRPAHSERRPVVPLAAVQQDRTGKYVFVLDDQNRAVQRRIEANQQVEQAWAVESGLQEGETVIVQGLQNVRPGITVRPSPAPAGQAAGTGR